MRKIEWTYGVDPKSQGYFWPVMESKREDYFHVRTMQPEVAQATYQCDPTARLAAVFKDEDFTTYYQAPEELPMGPTLSPVVADLVNKGSMILQAWDTAFSATQFSDHTACVTALLVPSDVWHNGEDELLLGPCDPHYIVWILDVLYKKLSFAEVVHAIRSEYVKWQPHTVVVEKKAYGSTALETLAQSGLPLEPITPEANKRARAVEGVGAGSVQGWFRQKRVWMPNRDFDWVKPFVSQMKDFSGKDGGKDDSVDAVVHLIRHAIQMGTGASMPPGWQTVEQANRNMGMRADGSEMDMFEHIMNMNTQSPMDRTCGNCAFYDPQSSYCGKHNRKHISLDSCWDYTMRGAKPVLNIAPEMISYRMRG
jgi:predicted phage terminase large subunit-like protein